MKVLVAMSGGVDSSVAAARLIDAGHDVTGVHLALAKKMQTGRGCCTLDDARDARRVADMLEIPYYVWDFADEFKDKVIGDFLAEYAQGRTPNPCLRCNEFIKFAAVLDRALALGFDAVATGHYAQIRMGQHGPELHRAVDPAKDQSYVLGVLHAWQLAHALFPLGADVKDDVRIEAAQRGLLVAKKPDSHDICFIPDGDTAGFLSRHLGEQPGAIVDAQSGEQLGSHQGTFAYTIGQRRGLALATPAPDGQPRYVVDISISTSTVQVGPAHLLDVTGIEGVNLTWAGPPLSHAPTAVTAQMRAHGEAIPATAQVHGDRLIVELLHPIRGLATGQTIVVYDDTRVIGSATIDRTIRVA
jgi:tRNA-uridine 2-sulfurtransferase